MGQLACMRCPWANLRAHPARLAACDEDDLVRPDVDELLQQRPRYYRSTQMPVAGWFHPCRYGTPVSADVPVELHGWNATAHTPPTTLLQTGCADAGLQRWWTRKLVSQCQSVADARSSDGTRSTHCWAAVAHRPAAQARGSGPAQRCQRPLQAAAAVLGAASSRSCRCHCPCRRHRSLGSSRRWRACRRCRCCRPTLCPLPSLVPSSRALRPLRPLRPRRLPRPLLLPPPRPLWRGGGVLPPRAMAQSCRRAQPWRRSHPACTSSSA
jgi:hypothetical protein